MTAEELLRMPADHMRHELIAGKLTTAQLAECGHGVVTVALSVPLALHVKATMLGIVVAAGTGFVIGRNPDTVCAPDIAFVARDRIPPGPLTPKFWPGSPDLAVEVVSPDDTAYEVDEKVKMWLDAGCKLVWVVNPKRRIVTVCSSCNKTSQILSETDTLDGENVVPDFAIPVRDIFP
jgi:Uma2 family endonuclease